MVFFYLCENLMILIKAVSVLALFATVFVVCGSNSSNLTTNSFLLGKHSLTNVCNLKKQMKCKITPLQEMDLMVNLVQCSLVCRSLCSALEKGLAGNKSSRGRKSSFFIVSLPLKPSQLSWAATVARCSNGIPAKQCRGELTLVKHFTLGEVRPGGSESLQKEK